MLATRGQADRFRWIRVQAQDPISQALGIEQFTRLAIFLVGIARVLLIKTADNRVKFLQIFQF